MQRFQQINEYDTKRLSKKTLNEFAFLSDLNEDGEDTQDSGQQAPEGGAPNAGDPMMGGGQGNQPQGGAGAPGQDAPMGPDNGQPMGGGGDAPMSPDNGPDMGGGGDAPMGPDNGSDMGGAPEAPMGPVDTPDMGGAPMSPDTDPMADGSNDEVIDVEDLTQSQESTELRIDDMNDKLDKLVSVLDKYSKAVDDLDMKIADVKQEIAHRMPTKQEKLNLRSVSSTPYQQTPEEFWSKKLAMNPNYSLEKDEKERESFEITEDDLEGYNNYDVLRSFNENKKMELKNYLKF